MPATHFILADYGRYGASWVERNANETDRETTIRDLMSMQVDKPLKVFAAEDGRWTDVSEDIARTIAQRADGPIPQGLMDFIENHCGTLLVNELEAA